MLPNTAGYDKSALDNLPSGLAIVIAAFHMPCGEICKSSSNPTRKSFIEKFKADVVGALKAAGYGASQEDKIQVLNIVEVLSETAIQFTLWPLSDSTDSITQANAFKSQLDDANSALRNGQITKDLDPSVFGVDVIKSLTNDGAARLSD